jgi:CBS domain-containing protein
VWSAAVWRPKACRNLPQREYSPTSTPLEAPREQPAPQRLRVKWKFSLWRARLFSRSRSTRALPSLAMPRYKKGKGMATVRHLLDRKGRAIFSIGPNDPVLEGIRLMAEHHVGALLVMKADQLVGIVSERDYARKVILKGRSSAETPVSQIMSSPVVTVTLNSSVQECMQLMTVRHLRHLPVLDDGKVIGMVSIGDLVKAVMEEQKQTIEQLESYIHH